MNTAVPTAPDEATIVRLLQASRAEAANGRMPESDQLLARLAQHAPDHPAVLNELGVRMMGRGAAEQARGLFERALKGDPRQPAIWSNLAGSLKVLGNRAAELDAIDKALELEPRLLSALLQKGDYLERSGDPRNASRMYQNALATIPPGAQTPPAVQGLLEHARALVAADLAALNAELEAPMAEIRARHGGGKQRRVDQCLELLLGQRRAYHSAPTWMYFPELPAIEFFERSEFPWLDAIEAGTEQMRAELLRVMVTDRDGLQPYIDFPAHLPLDQFRELNQSRRWSAYFLWNQSEAVEPHIAQCPETARLLETTPRCRVAGRAPTAFFSILDAKTHIPAHVGVTNTRLTVHVPLVVPPGCGFRVGGTTREWVPGQAWVFDDTIEHEAWNQSDTPRAILIFDVWNPLLTAAERDLIQTATEIYGSYYSIRAESPL